MASKLNIFNALPSTHSDDEDTGNKGSKGGNTQPKKDRVRKKGPGQGPVSSEPKTVPKEGHYHKNQNSRDHNLKKAANDLDHPHTLDRKSGTGEQAFGRHDKKGGAGRFNKGSYKDDLRGPRGEGEKGGDNEGEESGSAGEEEDNTITWDDYASHTTAASKQQVNDTKAKITDEQLKKELGKATLLQGRTKEVDDRTETRTKKSNATVTGMNTDHAELLGFRTGFKVYDGPKKKPFEKTGETKPAEGEKTEGTEEKKGEDKPAEDTGAKAEKTEEKSPEGGNKGGYKGGYKGGDREGGYKGGYKGDREGGYKGGDKGGYKGGDREGGYKGGDKGGYKGGDKGGYKGGQKKPTFNAEDESLFPKLG